MYPGEQALQGWIAAAQSPEKRMELIEKDRRRRAQLSAVEAGRAAVAPKEQPQAPAAGGAPVIFTASTVQIRELVNPTTDPRFWDAIAERAMSDPDLIGTDVGQTESRRTRCGDSLGYAESRGRGIALRARVRTARCASSKTAVPAVREYFGNRSDESVHGRRVRKLVPNKQVQDYELSRAKAGRRTSLRWAVTWRQARLRRGKWTKVCSIPLRR